jgi:integrase
MLDALTGTAKRAIALMFFTGLRPGEARAAKWTDLDRDGKVLRVHSSMWRTTTTSTKTAASEGVVPICSALREILEESKRESEYILTSPAGKPADLRNLAYRVIVPRLLRCAKCDKEKKGHDEQADHVFQQLPAWRGWYALRRGCATLVTTLDSAIAAKGMLRHTDLSTTSKHYIKDVPAETLRAAERMDALFQRSNSAPN